MEKCNIVVQSAQQNEPKKLMKLIGKNETREENHANFLDGYEDVKRMLKGVC